MHACGVSFPSSGQRRTSTGVRPIRSILVHQYVKQHLGAEGASPRLFAEGGARCGIRLSARVTGASLHSADGWRTVRELRGPYAAALMLEWGSITKGLVGTTACLT